MPKKHFIISVEPPVRFQPPGKFLTQIPDPEDAEPIVNFCDNTNCEAPANVQVDVSESTFADSKRWYCEACAGAYYTGLQHAEMRPRPVVITVDRGMVDAVYADKDTTLAISIADGDTQSEQEEADHKQALLKIKTLNLKQIHP